MNVSDYISNKIIQLSTIGGIGSGIVHMHIVYTTASISVNFCIPKIQLLHIDTKGMDIVEYACAISEAGLMKKCESLDMILDYDNDSIFIDKESEYILDLIEIEEE